MRMCTMGDFMDVYILAFAVAYGTSGCEGIEGLSLAVRYSYSSWIL